MDLVVENPVVTSLDIKGLGEVLLQETTLPLSQGICLCLKARISKPLEDLYPFLDRDEFKKNRIMKPLDE